MSGPLVYLTVRSVANRLARQAARLRRPRYFLALLLGIAWLGFVFWQQRPAPPPVRGDGWLLQGGTVLLLGLVVWAWVSGGDGRALVFSPAEVMLLFPAPLSRRTLVRYKLLRTQLLVWLNVAIWMLFGIRGRGAEGMLLRAAAIWTLITTLSLHRLGAALVRTSLAEHGRFGLRHRIASVAVVLAGTVALAASAHDVLPGLVAAARHGAGLAEALGRALHHPVLAVLLWPFRAMIRPLGAATPAEWRAAMLPALGILAVHYVWVVRSDTAFEEAAAEASLARARRMEARRASGALVHRGGGAPSAPLFPLGARGWPATAIFWKNLAAVLRRRRARNIVLGLAGAGLLVAVSSMDPENTLARVAGTLALTWLGFAAVLGPQWVRNDLRADLLHDDLLRSYPVPGWAIVASETAASAVTLTLLELALGVIAYLSYVGDATLDIAPAERLALLGAGLLFLPPINFMAMLLQNGAAVYFPAWVRIGASATGVEALGQRLLATTAFLLGLGLLLTAPLAAGVVTVQALAPSLRAWSLGPGSVVFMMVLAIEALLLVRRLGRAFERMDAGLAHS